MGRNTGRPRAIAFALTSLGLLLLGGCSNLFGPRKPPELQPPAVTISHQVYSGTLLSGPTTAEVKPDVPPQLIASVQLFALRSFDGSLGKPIGSGARLISANRGGSTLQATTSLIGKARYTLDPESAADLAKLVDAEQIHSAPLGQVEDRALLAGTTTVTRLVIPNGGALELAVHRQVDGGAASVSLSVAEPPKDQTAPQREAAILDPIDLANPRQLLIILPYAFENSDARAVALNLQIHPAESDEQFAPLLAKAQEDVKQSADLAQKLPTTAIIGSAASSGDQSSLEAIKDPARRRAALVYLSGETGAKWCEDFSLVADDANLEKLAAKIGENLPSEGPQQRELLGWVLDRSTLLLLSELASDTKTKIAPELTAVLTRHAGEAGRHDSSMEQIVKNLQSKADLENRLIAENLIYLEDNSPAARVRAYDFLKAQGKAPAGFDPLGPPRERRAALEKATTP